MAAWQQADGVLDTRVGRRRRVCCACTRADVQALGCVAGAGCIDLDAGGESDERNIRCPLPGVAWGGDLGPRLMQR